MRSGGGDLPSEVPPILSVFPLCAHRCAGSNVNSLILIDPGIWADLSGVPAAHRLTKKDFILHEMTHRSSFFAFLVLLPMTWFNFSSSKPVAH